MTNLPRRFAEWYGDLYEQHGNSHKALGWPNRQDMDVRFRVMLDVVRDWRPNTTILDFGCGLGDMCKYIQSEPGLDVSYHGLDIVEPFVDYCRSKYPGYTFYDIDVLSGGLECLPDFDYILVNGVFTWKLDVTWDAMWEYCQDVLLTLWPHTREGLAVNVMSCHVDWVREDLFHLCFPEMAGFVRDSLSRHFVFRQDYGLYEYTTYVYRESV